MAELAFQKGKQLAGRGMLAASIAEFDRAVELFEDEVEYRMYRAWAEHEMARSGEAKQKARANARALAMKMLKQYPKHSDARTMLSRLS